MIFDKEIAFREFYCQLDNFAPLHIKEPYANIYISMTNACNAKCKFCCNEKNCNKLCHFNFDKFKTIMAEIQNKINIHKVSFTGGEPTLNFEQLTNCLEYTKDMDKNIFTVINTNGSNIQKLKDIDILINSIAISRHHYDENINKEIFQSNTIPTDMMLQSYPNKEKLHLSCNLIKEYIGTPEEVIKYLNFASEIGILDIGFVSLMPANEYCKEQFVDFNDLKFDTLNNVFITKNWNYNNLCRCRNYIYIADNAEVVEVYARYYADPKYNGNSLVFDGEYLRKGFNGEIIY